MFSDFWDGFLKIGVAVLCLIVLAAIIYPSYMSVQSDGQITYCYTSYMSPTGMPPVIQLHGFRPWRPDRHIATFSTLDEAVKAAEAMHCTVAAKNER